MPGRGIPDYTTCNPPSDGSYPNITNASNPQSEPVAAMGTALSRQKMILTRAWRAPCNTRAIGDFRAYNNAGDCLSRVNYAGVQNSNQCNNQTGGGIGRMHSSRCRRGRSQVNTTNVETFSGNPTYVYDSSNYARFRKQKAMNQGNAVGASRVYKDGGSSRCIEIAARNRVRKG